VSTEIRALVSPGEVRVAVIVNGILQDFAIWRPGNPDGVDDLYRGRVRAVAPPLAGCFVDLGGQDGFLPDSEGGKGLTEGDSIGVRVSRAAQAGKGARLTARGVTLPPGPAGLVARGPGSLRELAALHPDAKILIDNAALCALLRPEFHSRLKLVQQAFDDELAAEVEGLFDICVPLPGGGEIFIEPTRALVAIDVDSGLGGGRAGRLSSHMAANRAMLPELVRQIRLRDLAGLILVDFAGLPPGRRISMAPELAALLEKDPRAPRLVEFTELGMAEILRTRRHPPLHELIRGPHAAALRALREAAQHPRARLRLRALPAIVAALESDPVALQALAHDTTYPLQLVATPGLQAPGYVIEDVE
jgi:Ribonuclease G/E